MLVGIESGVATVTLNRPGTLNALSFGMLESLRRCLDDWEADDRVETIILRGAGEKAFCAGGDVRALYQAFKEGHRAPLAYFEVEYALDLRIHQYPKPIAALMDGIVMGGGMGLAQGARRRVVGDRTRMAMPETAIGLFPDVGGSYFLSRLPGRIGLYLGLVGPTIDAADALYCGLADVHVDGRKTLPDSALERLRPAIDEHFSAQSVSSIVTSLALEEREPYREWAARTHAALLRHSPTMLEVTFEQLRRGAGMPVADCFAMELGLVARCFEQGDFLEGIRALLIDKDSRPRWNPPTLAAVTRESVNAFFTPRKA